MALDAAGPPDAAPQVQVMAGNDAAKGQQGVVLHVARDKRRPLVWVGGINLVRCPSARRHASCRHRPQQGCCTSLRTIPALT
jgi:ribosomal protein L24